MFNDNATIVTCNYPYDYRSESPSQVFLILIQWLLSLSKSEYGLPERTTLAYDNMCNLERMHIAKKPLPLPPPLDNLWLSVEKVIDVFHFGNHVSPECKERFSPEQLKAENWRTDICLGLQLSAYPLLHG